MWNGIFKSYQVVEIIPVYEMTPEDWLLLDWVSLRNTAKNRIANALNEEFLGFAKVNIFDKGLAKPNYLWPVSTGTAAKVAAGDIQSLGFGNEAEVGDLTSKGLALDNGVSDLYLVVGLNGIRKVLDLAIEKSEKEELAEELTALLETGLEDYNDLDAALAIALELVKYRGFEYLQSFIDEADEALGRADEAGLL